MSGIQYAWISENADGEDLVDEERQRRYPASFSGVGGRMCGGKTSRSHGLRGIELITTFGTPYSVCKERRASRKDPISLSSIFVNVLFQECQNLSGNLGCSHLLDFEPIWSDNSRKMKH